MTYCKKGLCEVTGRWHCSAMKRAADGNSDAISAAVATPWIGGVFLINEVSGIVHYHPPSPLRVPSLTLPRIPFTFCHNTRKSVNASTHIYTQKNKDRNSFMYKI